MRKNDVPYYMVVAASKWTGNFERELIAYSMGVLDEVQMDISFAREELEAFYKEVFNEDAPYEFYEGTNDLLDKFLLETYQEVDDWSQSTFYNVSGSCKELKKELPDVDSIIYIQFQNPMDDYWKGIVIPRIKRYFEDNKEHCGELLALRLYDTSKKAPILKCDYLTDEIKDTIEKPEEALPEELMEMAIENKNAELAVDALMKLGFKADELIKAANLVMKNE